MCILIQVLSHAHTNWGGWRGSLNNLKFGTFIVRFPSDGTPSMTVKELRTLQRGSSLQVYVAAHSVTPARVVTKVTKRVRFDALPARFVTPACFVSTR